MPVRKTAKASLKARLNDAPIDDLLAGSGMNLLLRISHTAMGRIASSRSYER